MHTRWIADDMVTSPAPQQAYNAQDFNHDLLHAGDTADGAAAIVLDAMISEKCLDSSRLHGYKIVAWVLKAHHSVQSTSFRSPGLP